MTVKVSPGSSREEVVAEPEFIRVRVHAPPEDGKANKQVARMLAGMFRVPRSSVVLERGPTSRIKTIRIREPASLPEFLRV